ncbi:MAG: methyltransferase domain-containing protein [Ignavibacteriae bacterium]|nr:methyltransferase domain-containing protein [Ignavibacteriota bacterium]MCB9214667.1 methyltransferase domain-containing protein [Ignavibacteria bacterium]
MLDDSENKDIWYRWLLSRRDGENTERRKETLRQLSPIRDKVLERADLADSGTLLDVGCGDGLIGLGALESSSYNVIFSDISSDLLEYCRDIVTESGLLNRCRFELLSADNLHTIASDSVDVITTRSVLIYVSDKRKAFSEFFRVLKPGGRVSLFEPINSFGNADRERSWMGYDMLPVIDLYQKVRKGMQREDANVTDEGRNPMIDFDERDLISLADEIGFRHIFLDYHVVIHPPPPSPVHYLYSTPPNPNAYSMQEAIARTLSQEEEKEFIAHLQPLVESGEGKRRMAYAYLYGSK